MNKEIFDLLERENIKSVVMSDEVYSFLSYDELNCNFDIIKFNDARAAAFYAMGEAQVKKSQSIFICLMVRSYELTSCYTALTEAFFEKIPLVVFSFERPEENFDYRSIKTTYSALIDWDRTTGYDLLEQHAQIFAPIIIKVSLEDVCDQSVSNRRSRLEVFSDASIPVYYYSCYHNKGLIDDSSIVVRECQNSYGAVPRYFGNLIGGSNGILILPETFFVKDIGFFINSNKLGNVIPRILVYNCLNIETYDWLNIQNGIKLKEVESIDSALVSLIESGKEPTIYLWRGEL